MRITALAFVLALTALPAAQGQVTPAAITSYRAHILEIRAALAECRATSTACDPARIGPDDHLEGAFDVRWSWLRSILYDARRNKPDDTAARQQLLADAATRVDTIAQEAGLSTPEKPDPAPDFNKARADTDRLLAQPEFRHVEEVSFWDRFWAWVGRILDRMFNGVAGLGRRAPWLAPVLEWGFVLLCATGLLLWAQRVLARQRIEVARDRPAAIAEWQEVSRQWAEAARQAAAAQDWREAVHCLYWASVVELEGRNIWRQHRGRTPREYLRLLEPASPYHRPIAALTQTFERIWYGLRPAQQVDYTRVLALYEEVRAA